MSPEKPQTGRVVSFDRYKKSGEIKPDNSVIPISFTTKDVVMIRKVDGRLVLTSERKRKVEIFPTLRVVFCSVEGGEDSTLRVAHFTLWKRLGGKGSLSGQNQIRTKGFSASVTRRRKERRSGRREIKMFC